MPLVVDDPAQGLLGRGRDHGLAVQVRKALTLEPADRREHVLARVTHRLREGHHRRRGVTQQRAVELLGGPVEPQRRHRGRRGHPLLHGRHFRANGS